MRTRVLTGVFLAIILIPLLFVPLWFFYAVLGVLSLLGAYEILRVYKNRHKISKSWIVYQFLGTGILYGFFLTVYFGFVEMEYLALTILFILISGLVWFVFEDDLSIEMLSKSWLGIFYVGIGFSAISIVRGISVELLIYLLILTMATDVFAYFSGYLFGKHKLAPLISPKKTVEGAIGGTLIAVVLATMFALIIDLFPNLGMVILIFTGIVVSLLAQMGDLVASKIKRSHDVKDFSNLFPGHGGILDRFDSSIFAAMTLMFVLMVIEVL